MTKEEKKKEVWKVILTVIDEETLPKKVLVKGEESLDLYAAIAKLLNELETIKTALTS